MSCADSSHAAVYLSLASSVQRSIMAVVLWVAESLYFSATSTRCTAAMLMPRALVVVALPAVELAVARHRLWCRFSRLGPLVLPQTGETCKLGGPTPSMFARPSELFHKK